MPDPDASRSLPPPGSADEAGKIVARVRIGERLALARVMTALERMAPEAPALLKAMQGDLGRALTVGVTGPPGAGKSSLVNALIRELRASGRTLGVIAVDPSSPVSGGAILGDRIRMTAASDDDGVFIRSLASRGHLGGLSPAAVRVIDALDAAGKDVILIETVGTGQSEVDIAEIADVRVVVSAPGLGDGIQAMKAGLLEIADILVVNKADREGAERTAEELAASLGLGRRSECVPILLTSAVTGAGVAKLREAIDAAGTRAMAIPPRVRRRRRARYLVARAAADLVAQRIRAGGSDALDRLADAVLAGETTPAEAAGTLFT
jgi:LAO/AO transport system kinase